MSEQVWCKDEKDAWVPATVIERDDNVVVCKKSNSEEVTIPLTGKHAEVVEDVDQEGAKKDVENLVDLESFTEGMVLHHIKKRYEANKIYTFVGSILVAVNPFQGLPIYSKGHIDDIRAKTAANEAASPHVFTTAGTAYHFLEDTNLPQSVLISGESGAGKTETAKKVLEFIAEVAKGKSAGPDDVSIQDQILRSNPVLESFGNAKTLRNDNSSRFGKWMEVNFDSSYKIIGSRIVSYLLEKIRVVAPGEGERNYHVFYMLLAGGPSHETWADLMLEGMPADTFHFLNQSSCIAVQKRNEVAEWDDMMHAMDVLSFSKDDQSSLLKILAGIMLLGNIEFEPVDPDEEPVQYRVSTPEILGKACALMGLETAALEHAFVFREMAQPGGAAPIDIPRDAKQAAGQRDAMAKSIYGQIFLWLIVEVNKTLYHGDGNSHIGLLDIFGFEVFDLNSFEQLCINFANEKLQFFFNMIIFKEEMDLYKSEGVPYESIKFKDNSECIDLIEGNTHSVLAMLDEEAHVPQGSDAKWVNKLHSKFSEGKMKSDYYDRNRRKPAFFVIHHFAKSVTYSSDNFMEKNKDELGEQIMRQMFDSNEQLLKNVFKDLKPKEGDGAGKKKGGKESLGAKFKADLAQLMRTLQATNPHFIRCVKANEEKVPSKFTAPMCLDQLKNAGLFEAIRIRKAGYMYRIDFLEFAKRYKYCVQRAPDMSLEPREICSYIIENVQAENPGKLNDEILAVGKTKMFLRNQAGKKILEDLRNRSLKKRILVLQSVFRMVLTKRRVWAEKWAEEERLEKERRAAEMERLMQEKGEACIVKIQAMVRAQTAKARFAKLVEENQERLKEMAEKARLAKLLEEEREKCNLAAARINGMYRRMKAKEVAYVLTNIRMLEVALDTCNEGLVLGQLGPEETQWENGVDGDYDKSAGQLAAEKSEANDRRRAEDELMLLDTISKAKTAGLDHVEEVQELLARCDKLSEIYSHVRDTEEKLEAVVGGSDIAMIQELLNEATNYQIDDSVVAEKAKARLALLLRTNEVTKILSELMAVKDAGRLVSTYDLIHELVAEAKVKLEVNPALLTEAIQATRKYKPLVKVRDELREAVELASETKIMEVIEKRDMYAAMLGDTFCEEEASAGRNMARMLALERQCFQHLQTKRRQSAINFPTDTRLPPYIFAELLDLHNRGALNDPDSIQDDQFLDYIRVFKWVINFSTWRHSESAHVCQVPIVGVGATQAGGVAKKAGGETKVAEKKETRTVHPKAWATSYDASLRAPRTNTLKKRKEEESRRTREKLRRSKLRDATGKEHPWMTRLVDAEDKPPPPKETGKARDFRAGRAPKSATFVSKHTKKEMAKPLKPADASIQEAMSSYEKSFEASTSLFWRDWAL